VELNGVAGKLLAPKDVIAACFDEEGQHMLEGSSEPTVCVVLSPKDDEVKHAVTVIARTHGVKSLQDVVRVRIRATYLSKLQVKDGGFYL
jgi:hypothetical protein